VYSSCIIFFRDIPAKKVAVLQLNMIGRFAVNVVVRKIMMIVAVLQLNMILTFCC